MSKEIGNDHDPSQNSNLYLFYKLPSMETFFGVDDNILRLKEYI